MTCSHVVFPAALDVWKLSVVYILQMQSRSGTRAVRVFARHCMTHPIVLWYRVLLQCVIWRFSHTVWFRSDLRQKQMVHERGV